MGKDGGECGMGIKDLIPRQGFQTDRGSFQKGNRCGIRAQNRDVSWSYAVCHRSLGRHSFGSYHQAGSEEDLGLPNCLCPAQWEENPCQQLGLLSHRDTS